MWRDCIKKEKETEATDLCTENESWMRGKRRIDKRGKGKKVERPFFVNATLKFRASTFCFLLGEG
jgi:hypothetical protein